MRKFYNRNYNYDPKRIIAKYNGYCSCGKEIKKGDEIVYYPRQRKVECYDCGKESLELTFDEKYLLKQF